MVCVWQRMFLNSTTRNKDATRNKCIASSNKCLTSSNKKLVVTSASLLVTTWNLKRPPFFGCFVKRPKIFETTKKNVFFLNDRIFVNYDDVQLYS